MNMLYMVFLLVASGLCSHREYHGVDVGKTWSEAQSYCRERYDDLATIAGLEDAQRLISIVKGNNVTAEVWIGLKKSEDCSWMWSAGGQTSNHNNWTDHKCGGMKADGMLFNEDCTTQLPFVCQNDEASNRFHVILANMSWRNAQEYCRSNHRDLASVMDQTDSQVVQQKIGESGQTSIFWIGLFADNLKWSDQSDASFRDWTEGQPNQDGDCVLYNPSSQKWYDRGCNSSHPFYCQTREQPKEPPKKAVRIVKVEIMANSLNESALSEGILEKLRKKFKGANLWWRKQPDGRILHKKKRRKPHVP